MNASLRCGGKVRHESFPLASDGVNRYGQIMRKLAATSLVFLGGFAVMVLEVIGARYLAKDFGSSFYVWISQIGVVLIALALGYYAGGALADRWQRVSLLTFLLVPAGATTFFIPNFAAPLIDAIILRHPAKESQNVVIIGTRSAEKFSYVTIQERAAVLIQSKRVTLPNFRERASSF